MNLSKGTKLGGGISLGVIAATVIGYFQLQEVIDENTTTQVQLTGAIAQAIDPVTEEQIRYQRRFDLEDYKFYYGKVCYDNQDLSPIEQLDFDDILYRLGYEWRGCNA